MTLSPEAGGPRRYLPGPYNWLIERPRDLAQVPVQVILSVSEPVAEEHQHVRCGELPEGHLDGEVAERPGVRGLGQHDRAEVVRVPVEVDDHQCALRDLAAEQLSELGRHRGPEGDAVELSGPLDREVVVRGHDHAPRHVRERPKFSGRVQVPRCDDRGNPAPAPSRRPSRPRRRR